MHIDSIQLGHEESEGTDNLIDAFRLALIDECVFNQPSNPTQHASPAIEDPSHACIPGTMFVTSNSGNEQYCQLTQTALRTRMIPIAVICRLTEPISYTLQRVSVELRTDSFFPSLHPATISMPRVRDPAMRPNIGSFLPLTTGVFVSIERAFSGSSAECLAGWSGCAALWPQCQLFMSILCKIRRYQVTKEKI